MSSAENNSAEWDIGHVTLLLINMYRAADDVKNATHVVIAPARMRVIV